MTNARIYRPLSTALFAASAMLAAACSADGTLPNLGGSSATGTVVVKLSDAPFPTDQVKSVDIFVVRVDGRTSDVSEADADQDLENKGSTGWRTLATPNASFDLLSLQNGATATLGSTPLGVGTYSGLRLIIDASQVERDAEKRDEAHRREQSRSLLPQREPFRPEDQSLEAARGRRRRDDDAPRGLRRRQQLRDARQHDPAEGLLFKPVINGSVDRRGDGQREHPPRERHCVGARFRSGHRGGDRRQQPGVRHQLACTSVNAATPNLSIHDRQRRPRCPGFAPTLQAGTSYTIVAYPSGTNVAVRDPDQHLHADDGSGRTPRLQRLGLSRRHSTSS